MYDSTYMASKRFALRMVSSVYDHLVSVRKEFATKVAGMIPNHWKVQVCLNVQSDAVVRVCSIIVVVGNDRACTWNKATVGLFIAIL